jgi:hypothetical protein
MRYSRIRWVSGKDPENPKALPNMDLWPNRTGAAEISLNLCRARAKIGV